MMLTIFISFLVCFLPLMLVNVIDDELSIPTLHVIASVLAWMSATVNPFIYAFKNRQYQQAFKKVATNIYTIVNQTHILHNLTFSGQFKSVRFC